MNRKGIADQAKIVRSLCEGNSIRATARMNECAINTVVKLLLEVGPACLRWHDENVRGLDSRNVQVDEIWSFVGCKERQADRDKKAQGQGDWWTWTALDGDSKLMVTWHVGGRTDDDCCYFMQSLRYRLNNRIQLSSDGYGAYLKAVRLTFGKDVDFGQIVKTYGDDPQPQKRYSPAVCTSVKTHVVNGDPMQSEISTSYVERQNLNIRMGCRRYTRLTNAFSKKLENHEAAFSMYAMFYNFVRQHQTLTKESGAGGRNKIATTPAMASVLTDHAWTVEQMIQTVLRSN